MTLAEVADVTGGRLVPAQDPDTASIVIDGPVVTDSREAGAGSLYVARVGEHADGHDFVAAARDRGAAAALTSRPVAELPCVVVDDVQTAFGALARAVLQRAPELTVVGITGSSGKTSTKDLLAQVLSRAGGTVAPVNSFNGEIGVPLTVCRVDPGTRFLVTELGARGLGHLTYLTTIAPPRIGVVLNVGTAHVGEFGGRQNIATAKAELVQALPPDGLAVLNADDEAVAGMAGLTGARVAFVGEAAGAQVRAVDVRLDSLGRPAFRLETPAGDADVTLRLHGRHHVSNALAVVAVGLECGMTLPAIVAGLQASGPISRWRMEVTERADGVTVVNDAYNANPDSMAAALRTLAAMATAADGSHRRTWAVLGRMLELGDDEAAEHEQVGRLAAELGTDIVVAVGPGTEPIVGGAQSAPSGPGGDASAAAGTRVLRVPDVDAAYEMLQAQLRPGDLVLLKSSRDAGLRWLGDRLAGLEVPA